MPKNTGSLSCAETPSAPHHQNTSQIGSVDSLENDDFYHPNECSGKKRKSRSEHLANIKKKKGQKVFVPHPICNNNNDVEKVNLLLKKTNPTTNLLVNTAHVLHSEGTSLEHAIKKGVPDWKSALAKNTGSPPVYRSPVVIIVCMSAIRAVELIKNECQSFGLLCKIGKLFAKHFSVDEQKAYLSGNEVRIAVGTPHRLSVLISDGTLSLSLLRLVVLDLKSDAKGRNLIESNDTSKDLSLLLQDHLMKTICDETRMFLFH